MDQPTALILDGNLVIGARVRCNLFYLIRSRAVKMAWPWSRYFAQHLDFKAESVAHNENLDDRVGQLDGTPVDKYYLTWTTYIGHQTKLSLYFARHLDLAEKTYFPSCVR